MSGWNNRGRGSDKALSVDISGADPVVDIAPPSPVPFLDLKKPNQQLRSEILAAWEDILCNAAFVGGRYVADFEAQLADYVGADHAVGVANGTDALTLALRAMGVGPGVEVITAANTFFATVEAIVHAGGSPVLVDVDEETATIDVAATEKAITPNTKVVVPVHLYGQPADMAPLMDLAESRGLLVLEDNAQALGAEYQGRRTGALGHAAATSFYPGKNLGACGDAGAVTTNDPEIADRVRVLGDHGQSAKYEHSAIGTNSRLDALQAAALAIKLRHLDEWNVRRQAAALAYAELLADCSLELPTGRDDRTHVYHLYVVRHHDRHRIREEMASVGIGTGLHYPVPIHLTPPMAHLGHGPGSFPHSERWAAHGLSLPMFPELTENEIRMTADALLEATRGADVFTSSIA